MNITVYLGASVGNDPAFLPAVRELGTWIGSNGHALVYGGSKSGLMGALADSVLEAGGHVTGVEPSFFIEAEFQHDGIDDLIVTSDMAERKAKMIELGDAFIAFPVGRVRSRRLPRSCPPCRWGISMRRASCTTSGATTTILRRCSST